MRERETDQRDEDEEEDDDEDTRYRVRPVPGLGLLGHCWAGFDRKANANGPKAGPKLSGIRPTPFGTGC